MHHTLRDMNLAAAEIKVMAEADRFSDFKSAWETFLFRLERAWERTERSVQRMPGRDSQSWLSANAKLRRIDPLLQYLKQARNTETHALAESIELDRTISISDRFGRPFSLNETRVTIKDRTLTLDLESYDIGIDWTATSVPNDPQLQVIINRGKRYLPPKQHLGNNIKDLHPVSIAMFGLNFYRGAYSALEAMPD